MRYFILLFTLVLINSFQSSAQAARVDSSEADGSAFVGGNDSVLVCDECFSDQDLTPALKEKRDALMLMALDGAGLFTLVGNSSSFSIVELSPQLNEKYQLTNLSLKDLRKINRSLKCGKSGVRFHFQTHDLHDDKGSYMGYHNIWSIQVYRADLMHKKILARQTDLEKAGLDPASSPTVVIDQISSHMGKKKSLLARDRLKKVLLGEPAQMGQDEVSISQEYKQRREKMIPPDGVQGAVQLIKDWYQGEDHFCSSENAYKKLKSLAPQSGI